MNGSIEPFSSLARPGSRQQQPGDESAGQRDPQVARCGGQPIAQHHQEGHAAMKNSGLSDRVTNGKKGPNA